MKQIKEYEKVPFLWMSKEYGWASFWFCPIAKGIKIYGVRIYPSQESTIKEPLEFSQDFAVSGFYFGDIIHDNELCRPCCWRVLICKEHNTMSFNVNVPKFAQGFMVHNSLGALYIRFY